jgi:cytochrome c oxidase subunit 2
MKFKRTVFALLAALLVVATTFIQASPTQVVPRRIEVTAKRFDFSPSEITLKKGEPVIIVLTSADVGHGIRFKELGIDSKVSKGQTVEIPFTPDKTGTFVSPCTVFCGSRHGTMKLTLNVVD